ncbi:MAG: FecR domain-containing protein [Carboxylicivirga sp.]|jgi:ferric-dicitrate binding protein FerR (iron transport regulator)|nr:FecR domain-containing protein [Carboxylicivirga sp.]
MGKNNELYLLIVRELTDEISAEESLSLSSKLSENPMLKNKYEKLKYYWSIEDQPKDTQAINNIFNRVMGHVYDQKERKRALLQPMLKVAVSILLIISISLSFLVLREKTIGDTLRYSTSIGEIKEVTLPDKTTVILNSSSTLIVPEQFTGQNRDVILMGEAFFDVAKDRQRPFRVETSHLQVEVLGTRFFLNSYQNEKSISTILEEGSIKLKGEFSEFSQYIMVPGQKAIVDKETMHMEVITDYKIRESWEGGYLIFEQERLEQIVHKLERKFGVKFIVIDEELKNYTYTGRFKEESVFEILGFLAVTKPFEYSLKDNTIVMRKE